jgi:poly(hydroxyalkanoate) granule-associated protein
MKTRTRTTRTRKTAARPATPAQAIQRLRTSTRKAVEAGVEAAAGVRRTAVGAFDALVKQGAALEAKSRRVAIARATEAREAAAGARARTVEAVSQLEKVFERRVSKAMSKLGVPTTRDVRALSRQVAQLQESVERLRRARARAH